MAQLGRKTSSQFTVSLVLLLAIVFSLPPQGVAQPVSDSKIIDLQERVDQILRSEASSSQADVEVLFDDLIQIALSSRTAILDTIHDAEVLINEAERRLSETESGDDETQAGCGPMCVEQTGIVEGLAEQIGALQRIADDMEISTRRLQERREEVLLLIRAEKFNDSIQMIEASFDELRFSLEAIDSEELERLKLNVPDILDCPGPGCPLSLSS